MTRMQAQFALCKLLKTTDPTISKRFKLYFDGPHLSLSPANLVPKELIVIAYIGAEDVGKGMKVTEWDFLTAKICSIHERLFPCPKPSTQ